MHSNLPVTNELKAALWKYVAMYDDQNYGHTRIIRVMGGDLVPIWHQDICNYHAYTTIGSSLYR